MERSEPTTEEIMRWLMGPMSGDFPETAKIVADRIKSQQRTIADKDAKIADLTARAEQAERERDAAVADMKLIVDAVREEYSDETCCFACKYDFDTSCDECGCCPGECPGFESNDCFEWRGLPQDGEGL